MVSSDTNEHTHDCNFSIMILLLSYDLCSFIMIVRSIFNLFSDVQQPATYNPDESPALSQTATTSESVSVCMYNSIKMVVYSIYLCY